MFDPLRENPADVRPSAQGHGPMADRRTLITTIYERPLPADGVSGDSADHPAPDVTEDGADHDDVAGLMAPRAPKGSSDRVLVVEDNPVNQKVIIAMLEILGFCVDVVDNGVEAVITSTMVPYHAILMDCEIPVLNGYEVTKEIRSQMGASRRSPIIAVTSSSTDADRRRCLAAGMDGHLSKPLKLDALASGMARWAPDLSDLSEPSDPPPPIVTDDARGSDADDLPVLDPAVLASLERLGAEAGEDLLGQLTLLFLADAEDRMVTLRHALAMDDGPTLINSAHSMCGASANVGAAELARLCAQLATDGSVGEIGDVEKILHSVEVELARVRIALLAPRTPPQPATVL
jgi:two-component system sensor histidine kinase/response regulator